MRVALLMAIAVVSIGAIVVVRGEPRTPSSSRGPERSARPITTPGPPELADAVTYRDLAFDPRVVPAPTASKGQSKLWYASGSWWGLLHEPDSDELRIYRLEPDGATWLDTGTLVDARPLARGDALAVGDQLYVVTAGRRARPVDAVRLTRFTFRDGAYRLDADFPIQLTNTGVQSVVLARDRTDRLWIAYTFEARVRVRASAGDDHHWGATFTPAVDGTTVAPDDTAAVVAFGDSVGLMWSNQNANAVYFSAHRNKDPIDAWSPAEVVSLGKQPDDEINMKADDDGRVYVALKLSAEALPNVNPLAPQIILAVRDLEGAWRAHLVSRVKDRHTRSIVVIDKERDEVYVIATSPAPGGSVYYKRSPLDDISFGTGRGTPLISSTVDPKVNSATSTKQSVTFESGLVVLASDNSTARYLHGVLEIGGRGVGPTPPPAPPAGEPQAIVNDAFDGWRDGELLPPSWVSRNVASTGATVQARGERGRVAQVVAIGNGPPPRVCRAFVPITTGHALVTYDVRARGTGRTEAVLALIRGDGGDAAQIRFGSRGVFGYFTGNRRVNTTARWTPDTWYRVSLDLDVAARSSTISIANQAGGTVLRPTRAPWPSQATSVDEICFQAAAGAGRPSLEFDSLLVARSYPDG